MIIHVPTNPGVFLNSLLNFHKSENGREQENTSDWPTIKLGIAHLPRGAELKHPWQTATTAVMGLK